MFEAMFMMFCAMMRKFDVIVEAGFAHVCIVYVTLEYILVSLR